MMDDRGEHCGRRTHSSVGGIYRSNRTVSTCPCHLMESVGVGACLRILTCVHWVVFPQPSEMSGWECFVCKYSLAVWKSLFSSTLFPHNIYRVVPSLRGLFVAACYSSRTQVCSRKHEAVQGFLIDFHCSGADNIFIIIIWQNIVDPGERDREM